jgi:hypothetical protein
MATSISDQRIEYSGWLLIDRDPQLEKDGELGLIEY